MKKTYLLLVISIFYGTSSLAEDSYRIDLIQTAPKFEIKHLGLTILRGHFNHTSGRVSLDPELKSGSILISIKTESIDTGFEFIDQLLLGENFLDAERYPAIRFASDKLHFSNKQLVAVDGRLSLHGITRPVNLTVEQFQCSPDKSIQETTCKANAFTIVNRSEFGINNYRPLITDKVKIIIHVQAIQE
jgi:polyisoprenoid-binding protein YceI